LLDDVVPNGRSRAGADPPLPAILGNGPAALLHLQPSPRRPGRVQTRLILGDVALVAAFDHLRPRLQAVLREPSYREDQVVVGDGILQPSAAFAEGGAPARAYRPGRGQLRGELRGDGQGSGEAEPATENLPSPPGHHYLRGVLQTDRVDERHRRGSYHHAHEDRVARVTELPVPLTSPAASRATACAPTRCRSRWSASAPSRRVEGPSR
jgi:hypothetical protein